VRKFEGHTDKVMSVSLSADGRWALSGSCDQTLRLWDISTGQCVRVFDGHRGDVMSVSLSADGRWALSGSDDRTLRLWELDWEYEAHDLTDWDEAARPHLINFLTNHTPYAATLPPNGNPTEEQIRLALTRRGKATWTDDDFKQLLYTLSCAGYGWLRPEGVRRKLEEITSNWKGPEEILSGNTPASTSPPMAKKPVVHVRTDAVPAAGEGAKGASNAGTASAVVNCRDDRTRFFLLANAHKPCLVQRPLGKTGSMAAYEVSANGKLTVGIHEFAASEPLHVKEMLAGKTMSLTFPKKAFKLAWLTDLLGHIDDFSGPLKDAFDCLDREAHGQQPRKASQPGTAPAKPAPPVQPKGGTMYCSECGTAVREEAKFCPKCGTSLQVDKEILKGINVPAAAPVARPAQKPQTPVQSAPPILQSATNCRFCDKGIPSGARALVRGKHVICTDCLESFAKSWPKLRASIRLVAKLKGGVACLFCGTKTVAEDLVASHCAPSAICRRCVQKYAAAPQHAPRPPIAPKPSPRPAAPLHGAGAHPPEMLEKVRQLTEIMLAAKELKQKASGWRGGELDPARMSPELVRDFMQNHSRVTRSGLRIVYLPSGRVPQVSVSRDDGVRAQDWELAAAADAFFNLKPAQCQFIAGKNNILIMPKSPPGAAPANRAPVDHVAANAQPRNPQPGGDVRLPPKAVRDAIAQHKENAHEPLLAYLRRLRQGGARDPAFEAKRIAGDLGLNTLHLAEVLYALATDRGIPAGQVEKAMRKVPVEIPGAQARDSRDGWSSFPNLFSRVAQLAASNMPIKIRATMLAGGVVGPGNEVRPVNSQVNAGFVVDYCRNVGL
jgi:hypothetical protein